MPRSSSADTSSRIALLPKLLDHDSEIFEALFVTGDFGWCCGGWHPPPH